MKGLTYHASGIFVEVINNFKTFGVTTSLLVMAEEAELLTEGLGRGEQCTDYMVNCYY